MKKILFFPLLRMPSGHHQVADTLTAIIQKRNPDILCKKVDLLSEWNPVIESIVTKTYLEWIHHLPETYAWVYKQMAYSSKSGRSYKYYELLFMNKMKKIISEEQPDLIICTHGFPSYFLSRLKIKKQCPIPVINVYTDFFINDVWGKEGIDYHFVPTLAAKQHLVTTNNVLEKKVFVTGIPTHELFEQHVNHTKTNSKFHVLVSGGSVGLGNMIDMLQNQPNENNCEFYVLCGKNKKLFQHLVKLKCDNIHPLPYISSRERMNELYSNVDAIITKPGGVTISEALKKRIPIFIHSALPGQEEINLKLLKEANLVHELKDTHSLEYQLSTVLSDPAMTGQYQYSIQKYLTEIKTGNPVEISNLINDLITFHKEDIGSDTSQVVR
ncbi:MGDG synthase family glycosyltransferase [Bacillus sp. PS06]|uniref:MGDG synthase family glycosyltransferase n=1 Tax=Bacillus sp. PS06 TaxID=2764176 RepID=UPI00178704CA|nr:glycosyltransferase [Bacillus sp. PS06]MBD8070532.1 galactosyldiacylglycerol synthase [Bacillus sp. PS06]